MEDALFVYSSSDDDESLGYEDEEDEEGDVHMRYESKSMDEEEMEEEENGRGIERRRLKRSASSSGAGEILVGEDTTGRGQVCGREEESKENEMYFCAMWCDHLRIVIILIYADEMDELDVNVASSSTNERDIERDKQRPARVRLHIESVLLTKEYGSNIHLLVLTCMFMCSLHPTYTHTHTHTHTHTPKGSEIYESSSRRIGKCTAASIA